MKKLIVIAFISLVACGKIQEGVVVDKEYEPSSLFMMMFPMTVGGATMLMPMTMYDGEDYILHVSGVGSDGKAKTKKVYVSKERYEYFLIGDSICLKGECFNDNNNHEEKKK